MVEGVKIVTPKVSKKGLRYDLTVPFARYVAMNRNDISLPFKRYQIQPVWRADRPQKGRYQEFYQCDADVIGTKSLISEAEIILIIHEALEQLGIVDFTVKINHRAVLAGIVECLGVKGQESSFYVAVDKLDKIGLDQVKSELFKNGFPKSALENLGSFLDIEGSNEQKIKQLQKEFETRNINSTGLEAIKEVLKIVDQFGLANSKVSFDTTLARGLSYYTGAIFEVIVNNVKIGSISGGGRYDDLTGAFGWPDMPGIGFSFGVDRIYDVMTELNLFPEESQSTTEVLIANFGEEAFDITLKLLADLRNLEVKSEIFPDAVRMRKQLNYADRKNIPFVLLCGEQELKDGTIAIKDMQSGEQQSVPIDNTTSKIIELLHS